MYKYIFVFLRKCRVTAMVMNIMCAKEVCYNEICCMPLKHTTLTYDNHISQ